MKAILCMLIAIGLVHNTLSDPDCESNLIGRCQAEQKKLYELGEANSAELYCQNSQALIDCISKDASCQGDEISKYRYTNLEYNIMNKHTGLCPNLKTEKLKKLIPKDLLQEHEEVDEIDGDENQPCAREIHWACVQGLLRNLHDPASSICAAVKTFRNCYEAQWKDRGCKSPLLVHFNHLLTHLNKEVLSDVGC